MICPDDSAHSLLSLTIGVACLMLSLIQCCRSSNAVAHPMLWFTACGRHGLRADYGYVDATSQPVTYFLTDFMARMLKPGDYLISPIARPR
jgi:hypothetical protein